MLRNFRGEVMADYDYSTPAREYDAGLFPFAQMFDCSDWRAGYSEFWDYERTKVKQFDAFEKEIVKRFEQYQLLLILLRKETPKEAVCQVFEKVNTGGVSLTVFELLTATYAADDFLLREDWAVREKRLKKHWVLRTLQSDDVLQAITLLATRDAGTRALPQRPRQTMPLGSVVSAKTFFVSRLQSINGGRTSSRRDSSGRPDFSTGRKSSVRMISPTVHRSPRLRRSSQCWGAGRERWGHYETRPLVLVWGLWGTLRWGQETRFAKDVP